MSVTVLVSFRSRSQIQIASRTFHFVLPPPPAPPEDSPSPSSYSSAEHRPRSPSVDITSLDVTSISPPSSIPPNSPQVSAAAAPSPPKKIPPLPESLLPNSNSIARLKSNKKRKKPDADAFPRGKPEVMPPKPQFTYAQLCYRAIKGLGGRASLQDICQWIQDAFEWYKYSDKDWEVRSYLPLLSNPLTFSQSSVRHNLSSSRAFKKVERGPDEKGKGALWSVDPQFEHTFEEQEARKQAEAKGLGKKGKGVPLDPPLKRSVKGDAKGPLPPPLTSTPLVMKTSFSHTVNTGHVPPPAPVPRPEPIATHAPPPTHPISSFPALHSAQSSQSTGAPTVTQTSTSPSPQASSSIPPIPPSVRLPIVIGPVPSSSPEASSSDTKPIVLHQNTLILNPTIFSHLTSQQLRDLEGLGAQKALEILQGYIVRFYKEKLRAESGRGRGRGRGRRPRGGGSQGPPRSQAPEGLFVTTPLPNRTVKPESQSSTSEAPPMASLQPPTERAESPVIIIDDDEDEDADAHVAKRPRLDGEDL